MLVSEGRGRKHWELELQAYYAVNPELSVFTMTHMVKQRSMRHCKLEGGKLRELKLEAGGDG